MATLSGIRQRGVGGGDPIDQQPLASGAASPKRNVLVNFARTMRSVSLLSTHRDLKAKNKIDFVATFVGTGGVINKLPMLGPEDGTLRDTTKTIPFSRADQDGFTSRFSVRVPTASTNCAFKLQGWITRPDQSKQKWGEELEFNPHDKRGLSSVTVKLDLGAEDVRITGAIDATAIDRLEDCWTATEVYASDAKTAAYDRGVDCWESFRGSASAALTSIRERWTGEVVVRDPKEEVTATGL